MAPGWAVRRVAAFELADVLHEGGSTTFVYGSCKPSSDGGCSPPLEIQLFSICDRNALLLDVRPSARFSARGVDVLDYGEGRFELATGSSDVVVWAKEKLARQAIAALRPDQARLPPPRYPRSYLGRLREVHDTYVRTHTLRAVRAELGISRSAARFELGLALRVGADHLRSAPIGCPR